MRTISLVLCLAAISGCVSPSDFASPATPVQGASCSAPRVFFDLGETLIDTATFKFAKVFYLPGARDYLEALRARHVALGLITNLPESWGVDEAAKFSKLVAFVKDPWTDAAAPSGFDWNFFEREHILLPPNDKLRKPDKFLFEKALNIARDDGCKALFQGEDEAEVNAAKAAGMEAFMVKRQVDGSGNLVPKFMPIEDVLRLQAAETGS